jgi:hypothetical protein
LYIPRGFLSTSQAVEHLHWVQNREALSGAAARSAEIKALYFAKSASKPPPITPVNDRGPFISRSAPIPFTAKQHSRLIELSQIERQLGEAKSAAVNEVRLALAEGDLIAVLIADDGREFALGKDRWRAADGDQAVRTSRLTLGPPWLGEALEGAVVIREGEVHAWVGKLADRPINNLVVAQGDGAVDRAAQGATPQGRKNKRGPAPELRTKIRNEMIADYAGDPERLLGGEAGVPAVDLRTSRREEHWHRRSSARRGPDSTSAKL